MGRTHRQRARLPEAGVGNGLGEDAARCCPAIRPDRGSRKGTVAVNRTARVVNSTESPRAEATAAGRLRSVPPCGLSPITRAGGGRIDGMSVIVFRRAGCGHPGNRPVLLSPDRLPPPTDICGKESKSFTQIPALSAMVNRYPVMAAPLPSP